MTRRMLRVLDGIVVTTHRREGVFQALLTADDLTVIQSSSNFVPISLKETSLSGQYIT
jgi:hypothetical protein